MSGLPSSPDPAAPASAQEITRIQEALRQSEASRRESQSYFEKSFYSSPVLMSIARAADGRIIEANPAFLHAAGFQRDEVVNRTTLELDLWLHPEQRDEFLRRIRGSGAVRDFEADFRVRSGRVRTLLLNADLIELGGIPCMLTVGIDITERRRQERTQAATYQISQVILAGGDLPDLFAEVHRIIGELMPARNFYVALLNADRSLLSFPYFVDETMPHPEPRTPRHGVTEFVIDSGAPFLASGADMNAKLQARGNYAPWGTPCAQWLGAPLLDAGRGIGVIAVQDYHNAQAYTEDDLRLLVFVAEQTAAAIRRQRTEAAEREARSYFEKSFHSSPALMSITRLRDGHLVEVNPAFLRSCGFSREEVIGRTTIELGLWVDVRQRDRFLRLIRTSGQIRDLQADFRAKDGRLTTLIVNADLIELGGEPCMLAVAIDITERRRREQVQDATYQISRAVLNGGNLEALFADVHRIIGSLMPAKNFYIALLNPEGTELSFPYFVDEYVSLAPPPRALTNGFTEFVLRTGRPQLVSATELNELLSARGPYQPLERPAAQRLGAPLVVGNRVLGVIALQDYANPNAFDDEALRLLNFVAEQTAGAVQQRQAETALAHAERRYRSIFENALEGLYVTSPEGRFLSANPALARMFGYASPEALLTDINDIKRQIYVKRDRRDDFFGLIQKSDEVSDFESEVLRRDGSTFWISESVRVVRNAHGAIDHFEGVATDITQQREAARALRAAKEAADAASRAKSYFLASVSHELRTPLNGILGYTQILRRDAALTAKQREGVNVIHESADHLLALINDVLDLSKIEAGRIELHVADLDLPEFALGVERVFMPRAKEKSILFESAVSHDLPRFVRGDEQRLRQIVFNLVANAVKFTKAGGVVFSVQRVPSPRSTSTPIPMEGAAPSAPIRNGDRAPSSLDLSPGQENIATIRFSVSDTGPGISAEDLGKLFEPFTQVGHKASAAASGTGLGLAISRSLVERMGGQLHVESKPGWGSRFWFDVPLPVVAAAPATPVATLSRVIGYEGPRRRVLIVDDNAANRAVMVDMLGPLGFELAEAADGAAALVQAEEFKPHLVLMDLRLPGIDGLEATRRLRARDAARPPADGPRRIIAVSASAYDLDRSECFVAGCDEFLAKPFREEQLWGAVARLLGLTWRSAEVEETRTPFALVVEAPPLAEASAIYELAAKGDVVAIRARAQALVARDPKYASFAQNVLDLAARFKMKAIRQFVSRYIS